jgi:dihydropyrimidinase
MSGSASRRHFLRLTGASAAALAVGDLVAGCPTVEETGVGTRGLPGRGDTLDLVIRGGQVVTAEGRSFEAVGIEDGKIAQLGGIMQGTHEIDASGLLLLPGGIDPHVHLSGFWADDFETGSEAALAGGITTIGTMLAPIEGRSLQHAIEQEIRIVEEQAIADVFLHSVIPHPPTGHIESMAQLVQAGTSSIKIFMAVPGFDRHVPGYVELLRAAGDSGALTMIHCEDQSIIDGRIEALVRSGQRTLDHYAESRPVSSEVVAVEQAIELCESTGAPIYIVHLSSERALDACRQARARGLPVYVEVRPIYLHLTQERYDGPDGPLHVAMPPLREPSDVQALWQGLSSGDVDTLGSDHSPLTRADKFDPSHDVTAPRAGVAELQTMLPMLFSEGVHKGRITLERFVALTSTHAAQLFGLYPRKGTIAVGSDADITLWDPSETKTVRAAEMYSRAGHSVYEGMEATGWPRMTLRRGEVVYERGKILGRPGSGQWIRRGPTRRLPAASGT